MFIVKPYDADRAVEYARRWAEDRNPLFADFSGIGGDCTSFVSQCLLAGTGIMDYSPTFGWYYENLEDRAPAWTGVREFYGYMTGSDDFPPSLTHRGPFGKIVTEDMAQKGDIIQLCDRRGNFYHSVVISEFSKRGILVCAHSDDALDRPLSRYRYFGLRFIHIEGARIEYNEDSSFDTLISGKSLKSTSE